MKKVIFGLVATVLFILTAILFSCNQEVEVVSESYAKEKIVDNYKQIPNLVVDFKEIISRDTKFLDKIVQNYSRSNGTQYIDQNQLDLLLDFFQSKGIVVEMNLITANQIINHSLSNLNEDFENYVNNYNYNQKTKDWLIQMENTKVKIIDLEGLNGFSSLPNNEKEMLINMNELTDALYNNGTRGDVIGGGIGVLVGAIGGNAICGPLCGLIGGFIGGFIGEAIGDAIKN